MAKAEAQPIHRTQIENLASRLEKAAGRLKQVAEEMATERVESFDVTNYPTMLTGLKQIEAFKNAAESGWDDFKFDRATEPASNAGESAQVQKPRRAKHANSS